MSRIYSKPGDLQNFHIDKAAVAEFFERRAEKIASVGPLHAVIYQDKNTELAEKRNVAEKTKLLPLIHLDGKQRVLDVGCGTGRWTSDIAPICEWYHGIDACSGLINYARQQFSLLKNCKFSVASAGNFSLEDLGENQKFDRVLCLGVLIYLNDNEIHQTIQCIINSLKIGGLVIFREPMGLNQRLTISNHYSEDMEQDYNAIYRTQNELLSLIHQSVPNGSFHLIEHGDVYDNLSLNNRVDTKQQWLLLERKK